MYGFGLTGIHIAERIDPVALAGGCRGRMPAAGRDGGGRPWVPRRAARARPATRCHEPARDQDANGPRREQQWHQQHGSSQIRSILLVDATVASRRGPALLGYNGQTAAVRSTGSVIRAGARRPTRRTLGLLARLVGAAPIAGPTRGLVGAGTRYGRGRRKRQLAAGVFSGCALEALDRSLRTGPEPAVNRSRSLAEGTQPSLDVTYLRRASGLSVSRSRSERRRFGVQHTTGLRSDDSVDRHPAVALDAFNGRLRQRAVQAINWSRLVTFGPQLALQRPYLRRASRLPVAGPPSELCARAVCSSSAGIARGGCAAHGRHAEQRKASHDAHRRRPRDPQTIFPFHVPLPNRTMHPRVYGARVGLTGLGRRQPGRSFRATIATERARSGTSCNRLQSPAAIAAAMNKSA